MDGKEENPFNRIKEVAEKVKESCWESSKEVFRKPKGKGKTFRKASPKKEKEVAVKKEKEDGDDRRESPITQTGNFLGKEWKPL